MKKIYYCEGLVCGVSNKSSIIKKYIGNNKSLEFTDCPEEADYIIYANTCASTFESIDYISSDIENYLNRKKQGAEVIVCGCITKKLDSNYESIRHLQKILDKVDYVFNDNYLEQLFYLLNTPIKSTDQKFNFRTRKGLDSTMSFVYPVDGCQNKCTFCKVHYMDMPLHSVPESKVMDIINRLAATGTQSIFLHASSLAQYGIDIYGKPILHKILKKMQSINEIKWIFLGAICAGDIYNELLDELSSNEKIKHVSIPIQSGSDRILKLMNRNHNVADLIRIFSTIRKNNPGLFFETGLICGFSDEKKEEVITTTELIKELQLFVQIIIPYINSEGVPSSRLSQLSDVIVKSHLELYYELLRDHNNQMLKELAQLPVLIQKIERDTVTILTRKPEFYDAPLTNAEERKYFKKMKVGDELQL